MNKSRDIVIIGCGAGGGTAAQFARKTDRKANITIIEKGKYPQYSKCGLPYAISGTIPEIKDLIEFSEDWFKKANINLLLNTTVKKIDIKNKIIFADNGNDVIKKLYDSLIICTGAKPFLPPIENLENKGKLIDGAFVVRTIEDAEKITSKIKIDGSATIIGAGLIGLEMADNLRKKVMKIIVVEALPMILPNNLDEDMAKIVKEQIPSDVKIFTNHLVEKIESINGKIKKLIIRNQETNEKITIDSDLIIVAARASMGKTAFSLNVARHVSQTIPTAFFSMEMSTSQLVTRLMAEEGGQSFNDVRKHKLIPNLDRLSKLKLFTDDSSALSLGEIQSKAKKLKMQENIGLIIVDYLQLINLMKRVYLVLTDSGGIQEEATGMGIPTLVLRRMTERPEGIEAGILKLVGTEKEVIISETQKLINDLSYYQSMAKADNPFGDGFASKRIVDAILANEKKS